MNEGFFTVIRRELKRRRYDRRTADGFVKSLRSFAAYFHPCHPRELSETDIRTYLLFLERSRTVPAQSLAGVAAALQFLYGELYGAPFRIPGRNHRQSSILVRDEFSNVINSTKNPKHRVLLTLVHSAGLRPDEAVMLKPRDIDAERHLIHLPGAKGRKDRTAVLPDAAVEELQFYFKEFSPSRWLFEGQHGGTHLSPRSAQRIFKQAALKAGIAKHDNTWPTGKNRP